MKEINHIFSALIKACFFFTCFLFSYIVLARAGGGGGSDGSVGERGSGSGYLNGMSGLQWLLMAIVTAFFGVYFHYIDLRGKKGKKFLQSPESAEVCLDLIKFSSANFEAMQVAWSNLDYSFFKKNLTFTKYLYWRMQLFILKLQNTRNIISEVSVSHVEIKDIYLSEKRDVKEFTALIHAELVEDFETQLNKKTVHTNLIEEWRYVKSSNGIFILKNRKIIL